MHEVYEVATRPGLATGDLGAGPLPMGSPRVCLNTCHKRDALPSGYPVPKEWRETAIGP